MMHLFRNTIRSIQSDYDQDQWYMSVTKDALYMAVGGFLDEANQLLKELWKHNLPHDRNTWLPDRAFEVLWYAAGKRPEQVPFEKINIDTLELEHRDYLANPDFLKQYAGVDFNELSSPIKGLALAALIEGKFPDNRYEENALHFFEIYLESNDEPTGYKAYQAFPLAIELAARNNKLDLAKNITKKWAMSKNNDSYTFDLPLIGANRYLAPLLLKGIIAEELGLTKEICDKFISEATAAIDYRITNGISLVYGDITWNELILKLSSVSIKVNPEIFSEEQIKSNWIGLPPASTTEINEVEKKLGLLLPDEYKSFLKVSNGLPQFINITPPLVPVGQIDFLKTISIKAYGNDEIFEIVKTYPGKYGNNFAALVESAIVISLFPDESEVWLIPPYADNADWECWDFSASNPGEHRYKNFRYWIEWWVQFIENYCLEN